MSTVAEKHWRTPKYCSLDFSSKMRANLTHEKNKRQSAYSKEEWFDEIEMTKSKSI